MSKPKTLEDRRAIVDRYEWNRTMRGGPNKPNDLRSPVPYKPDPKTLPIWRGMGGGPR